MDARGARHTLSCLGGPRNTVGKTLKGEPEARTSVLVVYLGDDPQKQSDSRDTEAGKEEQPK